MIIRNLRDKETHKILFAISASPAGVLSSLLLVDPHVVNFPELGEEIDQLILGAVMREISHKQLVAVPGKTDCERRLC